MTDKPEKPQNAQARYHQKQLDAGLVRLSVYVPTEERDAFWKVVNQLRLRWRKMGFEV